MSENNSEVFRFSQIRQAVKSALGVGLTGSAKRREAVIDIGSAQEKKITTLSPEDATKIHSVAKERIDDESSQTKENAIRKYIEIIPNHSNIPVIIDAPHAQEPGTAQIYDVLHRNNPENIDITLENIALSLSKINEGVELNNFDQMIDGIKKRRDENTGPIARRVAEFTGAATFIAKKPRTHTDLNRNWWSRETFLEQGFRTKEYARSGRAAFYWALKGHLTNRIRLNSEGKLISPLLRVSLHGMEDNDKYDFAVAGAEKIVDPEVLQLFIGRLNKNIQLYNLRLGDRYPRVAIARRDNPETSKYSGENVGHSTFRRELTKHPVQHPAFGFNFQTIQIEISAEIRNDPQNRELISMILAETIKEVAGRLNGVSPSKEHQNIFPQF